MPRDEVVLPVVGGVAVPSIDFQFPHTDDPALVDAAERLRALNLILDAGGIFDTEAITDVGFVDLQRKVSQEVHAEGASVSDIHAIVKGDLARVNRMRREAGYYHLLARRFTQEDPHERLRLEAAVVAEYRSKGGTAVDDLRLFSAMCAARQRMEVTEHQAAVREMLAEEDFPQAYQTMLERGLAAQVEHWRYIEGLFSGDIHAAASITDSVGELVRGGVRRLADTLRGVDRAADAEEADRLLADIAAEFHLPPPPAAPGESSFSRVVRQIVEFVTGQSTREEQDRALGRLKAAFRKRFFTNALEQLRSVLDGSRTEYTRAFYARKFLQRVMLIEREMGEPIPRTWLPVAGPSLAHYLLKAREICNTASRFELSQADRAAIEARVAAVEVEPWPAQEAAKKRLYREYFEAYQSAKLQVAERQSRGESATHAINARRYAALKLQFLVERLDKDALIKMAHYERDAEPETKQRHNALMARLIQQYRDAARMHRPEVAKFARQIKYLLQKYRELFAEDYRPTAGRRDLIEALTVISRLQLGEPNLLERAEADQQWQAQRFTAEQLARANELLESTIATWRSTPASKVEVKAELARRILCLLELYQQTFGEAYTEAPTSVGFLARFLGGRQPGLEEALNAQPHGMVESSDQQQAAVEWAGAISGIKAETRPNVTQQFDALEEKFWDSLRVNLDKNYVYNALDKTDEVLKKPAASWTDADKRILRIAYLRLQYYRHRYGEFPHDFLLQKLKIEEHAAVLGIYADRIRYGLEEADLAREGELQLRINQAQQDLLAEQQRFLGGDDGRTSQVPAQVAALQALSYWTFDELSQDEDYPPELLRLLEAKRREIHGKNRSLVESMLDSLEAQTVTTLNPKYLSLLGLLVVGLNLVGSTADMDGQLNQLSNIGFIDQQYDDEFYETLLASFEEQFEKQVDRLYALKLEVERTGKHDQRVTLGIKALAKMLGCETGELLTSYLSKGVGDRDAAIRDLKRRGKAVIASRIDELKRMRLAGNHKLTVAMQFVSPVAQMQARLLAKPVVVDEDGDTIQVMPVTLETMSAFSWGEPAKGYSLLEPLPGGPAANLYAFADENELGIPRTPLQLFVEYILRYGSAEQCERLAGFFTEARFPIKLEYNSDGRFLLPVAVADLPAEGSKSRATFIKFARKASGLFVMANYQLLGLQQLAEKLAGADSLASLLADPLMSASFNGQSGLLALLAEIQALPDSCTAELGLFTANARQVRALMESVVGHVNATLTDARAQFTGLANTVLRKLALEMADIDKFSMKPEVYKELRQFIIDHADEADKAAFLGQVDVTVIFQKALTVNAEDYFTADGDLSKLNNLFYFCLRYVDGKAQEDALQYFNRLTRRLINYPETFADKWRDNASFIAWLNAAGLQPIDTITNPVYRELVEQAQALTGTADMRAWLREYVGTTLFAHVERNQFVNPLLRAVRGEAGFEAAIAQDQARATAIARLLTSCLRSPADHPLDGSRGVLMAIPVSADASVGIATAEQLITQLKWLSQQDEEVFLPAEREALANAIGEFIEASIGDASLTDITVERIKLLEALTLTSGIKARFADGSEHDPVAFLALHRLKAIYNDRNDDHDYRKNFRPGDDFDWYCLLYDDEESALLARDRALFKFAEEYSEEFEAGIRTFLQDEIDAIGAATDIETYETLVYLVGRYGTDNQRKAMLAAYQEFILNELGNSSDDIDIWRGLGLDLSLGCSSLANQDDLDEFEELLTTSLLEKLTEAGERLVADVANETLRKAFDKFYYFCLHALPYQHRTRAAEIWLQRIIKIEPDSAKTIRMIEKSELGSASGKFAVVDEIVTARLASADAEAISEIELTNLIALAANFGVADSMYKLLAHRLSEIVSVAITVGDVPARLAALNSLFREMMNVFPVEAHAEVKHKLFFTWLPEVVEGLLPAMSEETQLQFETLFEFTLKHASIEQVLFMLKQNLLETLDGLSAAGGDDELNKAAELIGYVLATRKDFAEEYEARLVSWLTMQVYPADSIQHRAIMHCVETLESAARTRLAEHTVRVAEAHAAGEHGDPAAAIAEYTRVYAPFASASNALKWRVIAAAADRDDISAVHAAITEWQPDGLFGERAGVTEQVKGYLAGKTVASGRVVVTRHGVKPAAWRPVIQCLSSVIAGGDEGLSVQQRTSFIHWLNDRLRYPDMAAAQRAEDPEGNAENERILAQLVDGRIPLTSLDDYLAFFEPEQLSQLMQASVMFVARMPTAEDRPLRQLLQHMFAEEGALMQAIRPALAEGRLQQRLDAKQADLDYERSKWFQWARPAVRARIAELTGEVEGLETELARVRTESGREGVALLARTYGLFEYRKAGNTYGSTMREYLENARVYELLDQVEQGLLRGEAVAGKFEELSHLAPLPLGDSVFVDRLQQLIALGIERGWPLTGMEAVINLFPATLPTLPSHNNRNPVRQRLEHGLSLVRNPFPLVNANYRALVGAVEAGLAAEDNFEVIFVGLASLDKDQLADLVEFLTPERKLALYNKVVALQDKLAAKAPYLSDRLALLADILHPAAKADVTVTETAELLRDWAGVFSETKLLAAIGAFYATEGSVEAKTAAFEALKPDDVVVALEAQSYWHAMVDRLLANDALVLASYLVDHDLATAGQAERLLKIQQANLLATRVIEVLDNDANWQRGADPSALTQLQGDFASLDEFRAAIISMAEHMGSEHRREFQTALAERFAALQTTHDSLRALANRRATGDYQSVGSVAWQALLELSPAAEATTTQQMHTQARADLGTVRRLLITVEGLLDPAIYPLRSADLTRDLNFIAEASAIVSMIGTPAEQRELQMRFDLMFESYLVYVTTPRTSFDESYCSSLETLLALDSRYEATVKNLQRLRRAHLDDRRPYLDACYAELAKFPIMSELLCDYSRMRDQLALAIQKLAIAAGFTEAQVTALIAFRDYMVENNMSHIEGIREHYDRGILPIELAEMYDEYFASSNTVLHALIEISAQLVNVGRNSTSGESLASGIVELERTFSRWQVRPILVLVQMTNLLMFLDKLVKAPGSRQAGLSALGFSEDKLAEWRTRLAELRPRLASVDCDSEEEFRPFREALSALTDEVYGLLAERGLETLAEQEALDLALQLKLTSEGEFTRGWYRSVTRRLDAVKGNANALTVPQAGYADLPEPVRTLQVRIVHARSIAAGSPVKAVARLYQVYCAARQLGIADGLEGMPADVAALNQEISASNSFYKELIALLTRLADPNYARARAEELQLSTVLIGKRLIISQAKLDELMRLQAALAAVPHAAALATTREKLEQICSCAVTLESMLATGVVAEPIKAEYISTLNTELGGSRLLTRWLGSVAELALNLGNTRLTMLTAAEIAELRSAGFVSHPSVEWLGIYRALFRSIGDCDDFLESAAVHRLTDVVAELMPEVLKAEYLASMQTLARKYIDRILADLKVHTDRLRAAHREGRKDLASIRAIARLVADLSEHKAPYKGAMLVITEYATAAEKQALADRLGKVTSLLVATYRVACYSDRVRRGMTAGFFEELQRAVPAIVRLPQQLKLDEEEALLARDERLMRELKGFEDTVDSSEKVTYEQRAMRAEQTAVVRLASAVATDADSFHKLYFAQLMLSRAPSRRLLEALTSAVVATVPPGACHIEGLPGIVQGQLLALIDNPNVNKLDQYIEMLIQRSDLSEDDLARLKTRVDVLRVQLVQYAIAERINRDVFSGDSLGLHKMFLHNALQGNRVLRTLEQAYRWKDYEKATLNAGLKVKKAELEESASQQARAIRLAIGTRRGDAAEGVALMRVVIQTATNLTGFNEAHAEEITHLEEEQAHERALLEERIAAVTAKIREHEATLKPGSGRSGLSIELAEGELPGLRGELADLEARRKVVSNPRLAELLVQRERLETASVQAQADLLAYNTQTQELIKEQIDRLNAQKDEQIAALEAKHEAAIGHLEDSFASRFAEHKAAVKKAILAIEIDGTAEDREWLANLLMTWNAAVSVAVQDKVAKLRDSADPAIRARVARAVGDSIAAINEEAVEAIRQGNQQLANELDLPTVREVRVIEAIAKEFGLDHRYGAEMQAVIVEAQQEVAAIVAGMRSVAGPTTSASAGATAGGGSRSIAIPGAGRRGRDAASESAPGAKEVGFDAANMFVGSFVPDDGAKLMSERFAGVTPAVREVAAAARAVPFSADERRFARSCGAEFAEVERRMYGAGPGGPGLVPPVG